MTFRSKARRAGWLLVVAAFALGLVAAIRPNQAQAYGLIASRYIKMSSNQNGTTTLGQNVIYSVGFTTATAGNVGAIAIHFCANNPIIGGTCTAPTTFDINKTTTTLTNFTSTGVTTAGWSIDTTNSQPNALIITRTASAAVTANSTVTFDLGNGTTNGITNPGNTNTTFFARITLYTSTTPSFTNDATAQTTEKSAYDAGGVALSTANALFVTAKVQEALTFCVYTGANCAAGGNNIALGDSNGVLAATNTVYTDATPKFDIASNALGGVIVRLKGDTLTSGSFTITPNGATCTADSTSTSVEQFGLRVVTYGTGMYNGDATSSAGTNGTPSGTANDFSCLAGNHKFDPTTANTTYGQNFVRTLGATDISTSNFELAAKAANTTEAGVYKTTLQFIATATY